MARTILGDLRPIERLGMLLLGAPIIFALMLVGAQWLHRYFARTTTACGVECHEELRSLESLYILHRDQGYSCAAEFRACLEMVDP